ncbi:MAG: T9SS type A sorting domain-containing protein [Bacteroidia bacterium]|nr:T9SS type A sorting domain-containing protein [Bacteroidia bacterium]
MKKNYTIFKKPAILQSVLKTLQFGLILFICLFNQTIGAQQTYTFTNCGATGRIGPTQTMVTTAYAASNLSLVATTSPTSGIQSWTVPTSGLYRITAYGASGGDATSYVTTPGYGAIMAGDFNLTAGQVIRVLVGQMGQDRTTSAGGGGATYVTQTPHNTLGSILVVAGGGGGASQDFSGLSAVTATCGTFDVQSGPAQCSGNGGISFTGNSGSGGGGFFTDGQNGGIGVGGMSYTLGGLGGTSNNSQTGGFGGGGGQNGTGTYAGSAGGGFSGGNGGNRNSTSGTGRMGGGGGGSYNSGTNQLNSVNTATGHGRVIITELCSITLTSTGARSLSPHICSGATVTLTTNGISNYVWSNGNTTSSTIAVSPTLTTTYSLTATSPSLCNASAMITVSVSAGLPTLSIASSTNQTCLGKTVTLTASGATTYSWSNNVINGVGFTPTATANYSVTSQNACGTASAVTSITVAPLFVGLSISPTVVCAGSSAIINATAAATSYTWLPINFSTSQSSLAVSPLASIIYTVAASDGTCAGAGTVAILVNANPTIVATPAFTQVCSGDAVVLSATGGNNYTWTPGNLSGATVTVNPTNPTPYTVSGDNAAGCLSSTTAVVLTIASPTIVAQASSNFICAADAVTLSASGATAYAWSSGATTSLTTENPTITTVYSVTGTDNGCSSTQTLVIDVFTPTLAVSGPSAVCEGGTATLSATGANTYSWQPGNLFGQVVTVSPVALTVYTASAVVTSSNNISCPASASLQLDVNANPTITAVPQRSVICRNETTTISATGAATYTWNSVSFGSNIVVTSSLITTLNYSVVGTATNGCTDDINVSVVVIGCNAIHESGTTLSRLMVYPNPAQDNFIVESDQELSLVLVNQLGQVLNKIELNHLNGYKVQVNGLSTGIYFVTGSIGEQSFSRKIVINN